MALVPGETSPDKRSVVLAILVGISFFRFLIISNSARDLFLLLSILALKTSEDSEWIDSGIDSGVLCSIGNARFLVGVWNFSWTK